LALQAGDAGAKFNQKAKTNSAPAV